MAISKIVYKTSPNDTGTVWMDATPATATASDITAPKTAMLADGVLTTGTGSGGGGGGGVEEKDVNFIDYNGDLLYSYTKADFANLSAMPANPNRTSMGLSAQGWNWSLADAKTYVASYDKLWIGQMYNTVSGYTEIDVEFDGNKSPYLAIAVDGTAEIKWGDGSNDDIVTGNSKSTVKFTSHNFPQNNTLYTIKIKATSGGFRFYAASVSYPTILLGTTNASHMSNSEYTSCIKAIRLGLNSGVDLVSTRFVRMINLNYITIPYGLLNGALPSYMFQYCSKLKAIVLPSGVNLNDASNIFEYCSDLEAISLSNSGTSIPTRAFGYCVRLKGVSIPSTITALNGGYPFATCGSLEELHIPSSVVSITNSYIFYYCYSVKKIKFYNQSITLGSGATNLFYGCSALEKIEGFNLGNTATSLPSGLFQYCYSLQATPTLPTALTAIPSNIYYNCFSLEKATVPSAVTSIASGAFNNCYAMTELRFEPTSPPTVATSSTIANLCLNCKIYVPASAIYAYTNATNYPSKSTYTYIGFATYENGDILPTTDTTGNYDLQWYATKEDCINGTNEIYNGNGSEVYCWYTAL